MAPGPTGGGDPATGFRALLAVAPGRDLVVAALANSAGGDPVCAAAVDAVLTATLGAPQAPEPEPLTDDDLDAFAGTWLAALGVLEVGRRSDGLGVVSTWQARFDDPHDLVVGRTGPGALVGGTGTLGRRRVELVEVDGRTWLRFGGRLFTHHPDRGSLPPIAALFGAPT